jgi:hypothetical protein
MKIKDLIAPLIAKNHKFESNLGQIDAIEKDLSKLLEMANALDVYWSKSWIPDEHNKYQKNFDSSSTTFETYEYERIAEYIEVSSNISLELLEDELTPLIKELKEIQNNIISDLCVIRANPLFQNETEVLEKIEKISWDSIIGLIEQAQAPKKVITTNVSAINQGLKTPPHIHFKSKILDELTKITKVRDILRLSNRLLRQIEVKTKFETEIDQETSLLEINRICKKFSIIARQLQDRYSDRMTIQINDEYDVQDLFHALLKLFFMDIRSEEWTPSYAGGSSRMDFLLKNEKIVIEIKKTRQNLKDKDLGEQLLVDIARYETHPDCKILICFIYDPERRIGNPFAIMNDLNQKSTEKMEVKVIVEPVD